MKVQPECISCMLNRTLLFCIDKDDETKYKVLREVCRIFGNNISRDLKTVELASLRNKVIEEITKDKDPLCKLKNKSFSYAMKLYPKLKIYVSKSADKKERFKRSLMVALSGNIIEFGVKDHRINLADLEKEVISVVEGDLAIDDSSEIYEKLKVSKKILYVTDNVAELVFDKIFIEELSKQFAFEIYISPLSRTVQDDAGIEDVKKAGLDKIAKIVPRGDFIGVWFGHTTKKFLKIWIESDFVIAKGMACFETLTEFPEMTSGRKVASLFKAKCRPVARESGVKLGERIIKIL